MLRASDRNQDISPLRGESDEQQPERDSWRSGSAGPSQHIMSHGRGLPEQDPNKTSLMPKPPATVSSTSIPQLRPVALETARLCARVEGIPVGISSGAAIAAAVELGKRADMAGKTIVLIVPSFAERYLSTALFEDPD